MNKSQAMRVAAPPAVVAFAGGEEARGAGVFGLGALSRGCYYSGGAQSLADLIDDRSTRSRLSPSPITRITGSVPDARITKPAVDRQVSCRRLRWPD